MKDEFTGTLLSKIFGRDTVELQTGDGDFPEATRLDGMIFERIEHCDSPEIRVCWNIALSEQIALGIQHLTVTFR